MERIAVVGAGPVGSLAAIALAERGCQVDLYERQPLRSSTTPSAGNTRSINLAISTRALTALASLTPSSQEETLADLVLANGIPMRARMIHHMPQAVSNAQASSSSKAAAAGLDLRESGSVYVKLPPSVEKEHPRTRPEIQRGDSVAAFDSIAPSPSSTDINQPQASTSISPQDMAEIKLDSQDYGIDPLSHQIYSVDRSRLSQLLLARAEAHPAIRVRWGCVLQDVHFEQDGVELKFEHTTDGMEEKKEIIKERADMVIGCDGMHSVVRRSLNNYQPLDVSQTYIDSAYLELHIPAPRSTEEGGWPLSPNHLHIWPRNSFMLIALPNSDRSFTCTLFAPYAMFGAPPPASTSTSAHPLAGALSEPSSALSLFRTYFPDALSLLGEDHLLQAIQARASRPGRLGSVLLRGGGYHERSGGRAVLLGDAAHAMVPFYGQGLNCGLEDVRVLIETLESEGVLPRRGVKGQERSRVAHALGVYSRKRHPALCAILRLAQQNYEEMSHRVVSRTYLARRWIDGVLMRLLAPGPGTGTVTVVGDTKGKDRRVVNNTTTIIDLSLSLLRSFTSSSKLSTFPPTPPTSNKLTTRTTTTAPSERALGAWKSLYTMVTFTNMPYDAVLAQAKRQDRIVSFASAGLVGVGVVGLVVGVWGVWR
ncbi:hypothetical protein CF319_g2629 [Tilletia indica]|nr:hypothetical protein CF319_g2629 [Tilletia indica]